MSMKSENEPKQNVCELVCTEENLNEKNSSFLVTYANGMLKKGNKRLKLHCFQNSVTSDGLARKRTRKILLTDTGKMHYVGYNFGTIDTQRGEIYKNYIGVLNKKTRKMTVYHTEHIHCNPVLSTSKPVEAEDEETSYSKKVDALTSAFGSKLKRKALETRLNFAVEDSAVSADILDTLKKSASENPHVSQQTGTIEMIPPQNKSATEVKNVYQLDDLISPLEYSALNDLAKPLIEAIPSTVASWGNEGKYSKFVLNQFEGKSVVRDLHKAKLLIYYNFLIQMMNAGYKEFKLKKPLSQIPEPFNKFLLDQFTVTSMSARGSISRTMPKQMKDKAQAYAIVLALLAGDFCVDITLFVKDFKCSMVQVTKIANVLGCQISTSKKSDNVKFVELKIPLFIPSQKRFGKRKL